MQSHTLYNHVAFASCLTHLIDSPAHNSHTCTVGPRRVPTAQEAHEDRGSSSQLEPMEDVRPLPPLVVHPAAPRRSARARVPRTDMEDFVRGSNDVHLAVRQESAQPLRASSPPPARQQPTAKKGK